MGFFKRAPEEPAPSSEDIIFEKKLRDLESRLRLTENDQPPSQEKIGEVMDILKDYTKSKQLFESVDFAISGGNPVTGTGGDAEMKNKWLMAMARNKADLAKAGLYILDRIPEDDEGEDDNLPMAAA